MSAGLMASNQDSLESYNNVAQLHDRLMQNAANSASFNCQEEVASRAAVTHAAAPPTTHHVNSDAQEDQDQHIVQHSPSTNLARLKSAVSAPDMAPTVDESPSKADGGTVTARSFHNFPIGYEDGDTQPMPSQVYKDYTKSMALQKSRLVHQSYNNDFTQYTTQQTTQQQEASLAEGDSGHVNLMDHIPQSLEQPEYHEISSDAGSEDDGPGGGGESQYLLSSVQRPTFPRTPATAGQKRNHRGEPVSVASTTTPGSGLSAFGHFGNTAAMSATQMFQATQAVSSPLQAAPRSDPVFTRPSPNLNNRSSPVLNFESPIAATQTASHARATTEPRDVYFSMKDSQDRRRRSMSGGHSSRAGVGADPGPGIDEDPSEAMDDYMASHGPTGETEDEGSAQLRQARKRQHALLSKQAMRNWDSVKAPPRSSPRPAIASPVYGHHVPRITFRRSASRDREAVVEVPNAQSPDADPLDEYDELAQEVLPSQRDATSLYSESSDEEDQQDETALSPNVSDQENDQDKADEEDQDYQPSSPSQAVDHRPVLPQRHRQLDRESATHHSAAVQEETSNGDEDSEFAIADSQPGRQGRRQSPLPIAPSSMNSVVPASQFPTTVSDRPAADPGKSEDVKSPTVRLPLSANESGDSASQYPVPSSPPPVIAYPVPKEGATQDAVTSLAATRASQPSVSVLQVVTRPEERGDQSSPLPIFPFHQSPEKSQPKCAVQQQSSAVPETDPALSEDHTEPQRTHSSGLSAPKHNASQPNPPVAAHDTTSTLFETAPTHPTSHSNSSRPSQQRNSQLVLESPRKAAGILTFADIATDPTPPDALQDMDVDVDFLTVEDQSYLEAMEPVNKRLRVYGKRAKRTIAPVKRAAAKPLQDTTIGVPVLDVHGTSLSSSALTDMAEKEPALDGTVLNVLHDTTSYEPASAPDEPEESMDDCLAPKDTRHVVEGAKDAHQSQEQPTSPIEVPIPPPYSVKGDESIGALAAPSVRGVSLAEAYSNDEAPKPKRGKLSRVKGRTSGKVLTRQTPKGVQTKRNVPEIAETPQSKIAGSIEPDHDPRKDIGIRNTVVTSTHILEQAHPPLVVNATPKISVTTSNSPIMNSTEVLFPGRVFALFKGTPAGYFPATCLGATSLGGQKLRIRFDDETTSIVEPYLVRRLELRRGDQVKVDLPGLRNKVYIITGLKDKSDTAETDSRTDVFGHVAAQVAVKERESLSGAPTTSATATLTVPITSLYLTQTMFVRSDARIYTPRGPDSAGQSSRHRTPNVEPEVPPTTPGSRSRRTTVLTASSIARPDFASPLVSAEGVFAGMAFAVSYLNKNRDKDKEKEKDCVLDLIQQNGGLVLEQGFNELFNVPELSELEISTPSKSKHRPSPAPTDDSIDCLEDLTLSTCAKSLGFVALIADEHSRRAKYMQALALSIPCLSSRWVFDSLKAGRPAPWPKYLLPAGESVFLAGAIRSRFLAPYEVSEAKLADTVRGRERLLQGGKVLLVGQSGKKWEARKAYAFLTIALGATHVRRVSSLDTAKRLLVKQSEGWNWVYVDGKIGEAEKVLFGIDTTSAGEGTGTGNGANRKRKRGGDIGSVNKEKMIAGNDKVKIVGDEFVVQSLILGSLLEV